MIKTLINFVIFKKILSNALPGWLGSDERWTNPTIFLFFFETFPNPSFLNFPIFSGINKLLCPQSLMVPPPPQTWKNACNFTIVEFFSKYSQKGKYSNKIK